MSIVSPRKGNRKAVIAVVCIAIVAIVWLTTTLLGGESVSADEFTVSQNADGFSISARGFRRDVKGVLLNRPTPNPATPKDPQAIVTKPTQTPKRK
jgi:hypothetical protein